MIDWISPILIFLLQFQLQITYAKINQFNTTNNVRRKSRITENTIKNIQITHRSTTQIRNTIRYAYGNFWENFSQNESEYLMQKIFSHRLNILGISLIYDATNPEIVLSSVYGPQNDVLNLYPKSLHFLMMFENPYNSKYNEYLNSTSYFAGFGSMAAIPHEGRPLRSFQMPFWLFNNHLGKGKVESDWSENVRVVTTSPKGTYYLSEQEMSKIETLKHKMIALSKETPLLWENIRGNVSFIATNDDDQLRQHLLDIFKNEGVHVDCPGKVGHNLDDPIFGPYWEQKIFFLMGRLFNVCPENGYAQGYVTEKLWQAAISSSIPIYWGSLSGFDKQVFSMKRIIFVDMKNISDIHRVAKLVHQMITDPVLLSSFYTQPTFQPGAWSAIQRRLRDWHQFIMSVTKHILHVNIDMNIDMNIE